MPNVVNAEPRLAGSAVADPSVTAPIDFNFLFAQTFADRDLEREVLALFAEQARRLVARLPELAPSAQAETAHLLKGSARGIGAWAAAAIAEAYEQALPVQRAAIYTDLAATFAAANAAIAAHLGETPAG